VLETIGIPAGFLFSLIDLGFDLLYKRETGYLTLGIHVKPNLRLIVVMGNSIYELLIYSRRFFELI
jgi:hypothetical protein